MLAVGGYSMSLFTFQLTARKDPLTLSCYLQQTMPLSHYTPCSHAVKNTLLSKEETDNTLTDKTKQVTSDMNQGLRTLSFQMLSFLKVIQTINTVLSLYVS